MCRTILYLISCPVVDEMPVFDINPTLLDLMLKGKVRNGLPLRADTAAKPQEAEVKPLTVVDIT